MTKQTGLGDNLYVAQYNISGDVGVVDSVSCPMSPLDVTGIDKSAYERLGGLRDGAIEFTSFFNDASGQEHPALSTLPRTDRIVSYFRGTTLGNPAASLVAKQINYDPTREADGNLTFKVNCQGNAYALEWGRMLTAGVRTDTTATNGTGVDGAASSAFGLQAYLHVFSFSGTSVTIKLQESSDNGGGDPYADVTGGGFTLVTGVTSERIATANNQTIERYLRVITTGTFSSVAFAVSVVRNETSTVF